MKSSDIDRIIELVEELYSVEILEYHNKNWLANDDKTRSIDKQAALKEIINTLKEIKIRV